MIRPFRTNTDIQQLYRTKQKLKERILELQQQGRDEDSQVVRNEISSCIRNCENGIDNFNLLLTDLEVPIDDPYALQAFPGASEGDVIHYCLGFAFSCPDECRRESWTDWDVVLALKKTGWQKGMMNGTGGAVDLDTETPLQAMVREFREETTIDTKETEWTPFGSISPYNGTAQYFVHCFAMWIERRLLYATFGKMLDQIVIQDKQDTLVRGMPFALTPRCCGGPCLPNVSTLLMGAAHTLLNEQSNVDEQASQPQIHLVYANL